MVVEDNLLNQKVTSMQLRKLGYESEIASDGVMALKLIEQHPFDLILMDCMMPELDGFETTRRLRQHPNASRTKIVALTANDREGSREKCLASGMNDYLNKATGLKALAEVLARNL